MFEVDDVVKFRLSAPRRESWLSTNHMTQIGVKTLGRDLPLLFSRQPLINVFSAVECSHNYLSCRLVSFVPKTKHYRVHIFSRVSTRVLEVPDDEH